MTQGDPLSPMIFNIIMDAMVREVLQEVCGPQESQYGFGWEAVEHNIWFYADDRRIAGKNPVWLHTALTTMEIMFDKVSTQKTMSKTKAMICTLGLIWGQQGVAVYKSRSSSRWDFHLHSYVLTIYVRLY